MAGLRAKLGELTSSLKERNSKKESCFQETYSILIKVSGLAHLNQQHLDAVLKAVESFRQRG
jgi:hypothetical protein